MLSPEETLEFLLGPRRRRKRKIHIPKGFRWYEKRRWPNPLLRLKRKERLTWYEWLWDWRTSLHKLGFICQNDLVASSRTGITAHGLRKKECICLRNEHTTIFLYASVHAMPRGQDRLLEENPNVYHIVRGRRPDTARSVKRLEDNAAVGILPDVDLIGLPDFLVEFDDALFEFNEGAWRKTTDEFITYLYLDYREKSSHFKVVRPRRKRGSSPENRLFPSQRDFRLSPPTV